MVTVRKIIVPFILFLSFTSLQAQFLWQEDGIPIRQGYHIEWQAESAQNSLGESCYIWTDSRIGERRIYAQKYDVNGSPLWAEGGIPVGGNQGVYPYCQPVICTSSDDCFIITWGQGSTPDPIRAQKLSREGELLWDVNGAVVCGWFSYPFYLNIIGSDDGGAYILWWNDSGVQQGMNLQRLQSNGNIAAGWNGNGNLISSSGGGCSGQNMCTDGSNGVIIVWTYGPTYQQEDVYAQRIGQNGNEVWIPGGVTICGVTGPQQSPVICEDRYGGAYIVWQDVQDYSNTNLYMQRIDGDGNHLWQHGGETLCAEAGNQLNPKIIYSESNCAAIIWEDYRNTTSNDMFEIYSQRINESGDLLWEAGGHPICRGDYEKGDICLESDGSGGIVTSWWDLSEGALNLDIYMQHTDVQGQNVWIEGGVQLVDMEFSTMPSAKSTTDGGALCAWMNFHGDSAGIYLQKVDAGGNIQLQPNGVPVFESIAQDVADIILTALSGDRFLAVWEDNRAFGVGRELYYQVFDSECNFFMNPNGVPLCEITSGSQVEAKATQTTDECAIIAWETTDDHIYAQKIDYDGNILWEEGGVELGEGWEPYLCQSGTGGTYIAFNSPGGAKLQLLSSIGRCEWNQPVPISAGGPLQGIVEDGEGGVIAVYTTNFSVEYDIFAWHILENGTIDWTETICDAPDDQWKPMFIPSVDGGFIILWEDARGTEGYDIYGQKVDNEGNMLWEDNGALLAADYSNQQKPLMVEDEEGYIYFVFSNQASFSFYVYCQRVSPEGERLFPREGLPISGYTIYPGSYSLVPNGHGGAIIAWSEERYPFNDIYSIHLDEYGNITNPVWQNGGNPACEAFGNQSSVQLASDGFDGAIAIWRDGRSSTPAYETLENHDIYAQRINDLVTSIPESSSDNLLLNYYLGYGRPNPFNQSTTLSFVLPSAGKTTLTVYDITGREVARLVDGMKPAGSHQVLFDAKDLSSGVYFVRLEAGDFRSTKKMLLIK